MAYLILVLFYVLCPVLVIYLAGRYRMARQIGAVVICYVLGLILGNSGILPHYEEARAALDVAAAESSAGAGKKVYEIQDALNTVVILLAIPLLLFSLDVRTWVKMAGKTFLSLVLGLISVLITVFLGYYLFRGLIPEIWKVSGMLIGVYSGGTPNLAAIRLALGIDADTYIITHSYDLVVGAVVLLFFVTVARKFFLSFMRPFRLSDNDPVKSASGSFTRQFESYEGIFRKNSFLPVIAALVISVLIIGISFAISTGIIRLVRSAGLAGEDSGTLLMTIMILSITTLGILASMIPGVHRIQKTFQAGMYFILIFCLVVASMADIRSFSFDSWPILAYIVLAVVGSLLVHALLSKLFRIDADNFLIVSVALSMSPPFVPVVAAALKNRFIIIPGLVIGIIGYAIGNYLGVIVALILR